MSNLDVENADGTCSQAKLKTDATYSQAKLKTNSTAISIFFFITIENRCYAALSLIPSQYSIELCIGSGYHVPLCCEIVACFLEKNMNCNRVVGVLVFHHHSA